MDRYFVMIYCLKGKITPLVDDDGVMLFPDEDEAEGAAADNSMAKANGFQVFRWLN